MNLSVILCSLVCRLLLCLLRPASSLCMLSLSFACWAHICSPVCSASNGAAVFGHDSKQVWVWGIANGKAATATEEKACLHNPACMNKVCVARSELSESTASAFSCCPPHFFSFYPLCRFCFLFRSLPLVDSFGWHPCFYLTLSSLSVWLWCACSPSY